MGRPSSASNFAAASRALGFLTFGSAESLRWRFGLVGVCAAASDTVAGGAAGGSVFAISNPGVAGFVVGSTASVVAGSVAEGIGSVATGSVTVGSGSAAVASVVAGIVTGASWACSVV